MTIKNNLKELCRGQRKFIKFIVCNYSFFCVFSSLENHYLDLIEVQCMVQPVGHSAVSGLQQSLDTDHKSHMGGAGPNESSGPHSESSGPHSSSGRGLGQDTGID